MNPSLKPGALCLAIGIILCSALTIPDQPTGKILRVSTDQLSTDELILDYPIGPLSCSDFSEIEFAWTSNVMELDLFHFKVVAIADGAEVPTDLENLDAFYEVMSLTENRFVYPEDAPMLEEQVTYCWQIIGEDSSRGEQIKSLVSSFWLVDSEDCIPMISEIPTEILCPGDCFVLELNFNEESAGRKFMLFSDHQNLTSISVGEEGVHPRPISDLNDEPFELVPQLTLSETLNEIEICMTEGAEDPIEFSFYSYEEGSACTDVPFSECCCFALETFTIQVADIPDFQSLTLSLKDARGINPVQEICSGDQVIFSIGNLPTAAHTSLVWQYSDDNGLNWVDITYPPFVQSPGSDLFTFPVFPDNEALQVHCNVATAGYIDRIFRAQLQVMEENTICTYFTSEYPLKICCPISEANIVLGTEDGTIDFTIGVCEEDAFVLQVKLVSDDPFLQVLGDFVQIQWTMNVPPFNLGDQLEFSLPIEVMQEDICIAAEVSNCAGKSRTFTRCISVDPMPVCGNIKLLDPPNDGIEEDDILVYEICPEYAGTLAASGFDPSTCRIQWEYSYDLVTWINMGTSNTRQNTNIIVEGNNSSIFYRVRCKPLSDPSGCEPCESNIIEIREETDLPIDPVIDCDLRLWCEGSTIDLAPPEVEEGVSYVWLANGEIISEEPTLEYPLTENTCFAYRASNACYTLESDVCCVELCQIVAAISCPIQPNDCACLGEPIILIAADSESSCSSSELTYEWSWIDDMDVVQTQTSIALTAIPAATGSTYTLTVTDEISGCSDSTSLTIIPCDK